MKAKVIVFSKVKVFEGSLPINIVYIDVQWTIWTLMMSKLEKTTIILASVDNAVNISDHDGIMSRAGGGEHDVQGVPGPVHADSSLLSTAGLQEGGQISRQ